VTASAQILTQRLARNDRPVVARKDRPVEPDGVVSNVLSGTLGKLISDLKCNGSACFGTRSCATLPMTRPDGAHRQGEPSRLDDSTSAAPNERPADGTLFHRERPPACRGRPGPTISRFDVAHFLLNEVEQPTHVRRVVGIVHKECQIMIRQKGVRVRHRHGDIQYSSGDYTNLLRSRIQISMSRQVRIVLEDIEISELIRSSRSRPCAAFPSCRCGAGAQ
jgi:hypothetical protein